MNIQGAKWGVFVIMLSISLSIFGQSVAIVLQKGTNAFEDLKNSFIQFSFVEQVKDLNTKPYYLENNEKDEIVLKELAQSKPSVVFTIGTFATKKVREFLPDVYIVAAMIYYPEIEKFHLDQKTYVIASLGSVKDLMNGVKNFRKIRRVGLLYSNKIAESGTNFSFELKSLNYEVSELTYSTKDELINLLNDIRGRFQSLIVLPESTTLDKDLIRFIVTQCVSNDILPLTFSEEAVSSGFLFSSRYSKEGIAKVGVKLVKSIVEGRELPKEKIVFPEESETALNKGTMNAFQIKIPQNMKIGVIYE